jgi:hypothetical protein
MGRETFFGEAREVGYDVVTRSGQRRRVRHAQTDLPALLAEFTRKKPCQIGRWGKLPANAERWDAGFHTEPEALKETIAGGEGESVLVSDIASLVDERQDPKRRKDAEFDYIEISDVDGRTGLVGHKRLPVEEAPSRARKLVRTGDVLVSTVRPERGTVGVVPPHLDGAICSTGFAVLRCQNVQPVALAWLLKSEAVRRQMVRHNIGIAYPAIAEETCLSLVLPITRVKLEGDLSEAAVALNQAQGAFEAARRRMMQLAGNDADSASGEVPDLINSGEPGFRLRCGIKGSDRRPCCCSSFGTERAKANSAIFPVRKNRLTAKKSCVANLQLLVG